MMRFSSRIFLLLGIFIIGSLAAEEPWGLLLSWQRDPTTTMHISWVTSPKDQQVTAFFRKTGEVEWNQGEGLIKALPGTSKYILHQVELTGLQPDTRYDLQLGASQEINTFCTLPSELNRPIKFVEGGDMYNPGSQEKVHLATMNRVAANLNPDFIAIGGDIAYSSSRFKHLSENGERWLTWLKIWADTMRAPDGRLIPGIFAIGNHEVNGRFFQTPAQAPWFYTLFALPEKRSYRALDFGNYLSLYLLDTNHTFRVEGDQAYWLVDAMTIRKSQLHQIAIYHVPAYPAYGRFRDPTSLAIRQWWVPTFEKHGLDLALENHIHNYKRTYPLAQEKIDPNGVIYVGDGGWAVDQARPARSPKEDWFLANSASTRNCLLITLYPDKRQVDAYKEDGSLLDTFQQGIRDRTSKDL